MRATKKFCWILLTVPVALTAAPAAASLHARRPALHSIHYSVYPISATQRGVSIRAQVARADRCFLDSPQLTGGRRRKVPCKHGLLRAHLPLTGAAALGAARITATLEAVGRRGRRRVTITIRVPAAARGATPTTGPNGATLQHPELPNAGATSINGEPAWTEIVTMGGDAVMVPLAEELIAGFHQAGYPIGFSIKTLENGASPDGVAERTYEIGLSGGDPKAGDPAGLIFYPVAREGVCIITNPANDLANMEPDTVRAVLSGATDEWSDVPGATATGKIDLYDYANTIPAQETLEQAFLNAGMQLAASATGEPSEEALRGAIQTDEDGIGALRIGNTAGAHTVAYGETACPTQIGHPKGYGAFRHFYMITHGIASSVASGVAEFLEWVRLSPAAHSIIESNWTPLDQE